MGNVTIKCFKSADEALNEANFAKGAGKKVAVAGPTEIVRIKGNEPTEIKWESGANFDWYVVIATGDDLVMP
jgi:hypothetical protein